MSMVSVRAALETWLDAMTPALDTEKENEEYVPIVDVPYQRTALLPAEPEDLEMSCVKRREIGLYQVSLCYPLHQGPGAANARAELIRARFKRGVSLSSGGVTVTMYGSPEVGPAQYEPDRYVLPVRVRWFSNIST